MTGDGKTEEIRCLDSLKNRYSLPETFDLDSSITFEKMLKMKAQSVQSPKAATIVAYVYNVAPGGIESCNCHAKDEENRDTHITLVADLKHTEGKYRLIVEVTPRWRAMMKTIKVDWSTQALKKSILHKKVRISGLLFSDTEHKNASEADRPKGKNNWRGSCEEIHPVTSIEILQ